LHVAKSRMGGLAGAPVVAAGKLNLTFRVINLTIS
jgi:hypothetical protein